MPSGSSLDEKLQNTLGTSGIILFNYIDIKKVINKFRNILFLALWKLSRDYFRDYLLVILIFFLMENDNANVMYVC